jgi:hypothetical protein
MQMFQTKHAFKPQYPPRLPLPRTLQQKAPHNPRRNRDSSHDSHAHHALLCHLIIDQVLQAASLQIRRLQLQQQLVVPPCFCVVSQLVVAQRKVVEAFAAALARVAEDFGEKAYALLLFVARGRFYEALQRD